MCVTIAHGGFMWSDFPIFGGFGKRENLDFDAQDTVNLFLISDPEGKKQFALLGTPGLESRLVFPTQGAVRALYTFGDSMYAVCGSTVYRINGALGATPIGTLTTNTTKISITANNGGQLAISDGVKGYTYTIATGVFQEITAPGFPTPPEDIVFLDGFGVVPTGESTKFKISALNDFTVWDPLDFALIQAYPGQDVGVGIVNRRLYFFKVDSTEVWYNAGQTDFPFRADRNLLFNFGCLTRNSIVSDFGYLFWLARDKNGVGSVMMTQGAAPVKVSDESVDNAIANLENPSDLDAWIYKDMGHIFYVISWTTDDITFLYDITSNTWSRLVVQPDSDPLDTKCFNKTRFPGSCHAYFNGKHYVGSYCSPIIYEMSRAFATVDGTPLVRRRVCRHFFDQSYRMIQVNSMQLDMEMGLGTVLPVTEPWDEPESDPNQNPQVYLRISRDGGNVYGNRAPAPIGKVGNKRCRALWRKKGIARDLVAEFSIYAPIAPVILLGGSINYEVLQK